MLSEGIIVDVACGGGIPLIEACRATGKRGVGIELNPERAALAQKEVHDSGLPVEVFCEDGVNTSILKDDEAVAVLLYDPERPLSGGSSHYDGLQPSIESIIVAWAPRLTEDAAILFDLPPRFSQEDQLRVETLVDNYLDQRATCWSFLSRGASRVDRLMLHVGPTAGDGNRRCIRLLPGGAAYELTGQKEEMPEGSKAPVAIGDLLGLVDATIPVAKLWNSWTSKHHVDGWIVQTGRRPTIRFKQWPTATDSFLIDGGIVIDIQSKEPLDEAMEGLLSACHENNLAGALLRANIPPEIHSDFQRTLDVAGGEGRRDAVIIDLPHPENPQLVLLDRSRSGTLD